MSPADLVKQAVSSGVEGITLLGGEPFEQAHALAGVAVQAQSAGLSVMTFTGYLREELEARDDDGVRGLIEGTDLLVDGPFMQDCLDVTRPWVGSTNQRFHFLTQRYEHLREALHESPDRLDVRITAQGTVSVNGWASSAQLEELLEATDLKRMPR